MPLYKTLACLLFTSVTLVAKAQITVHGKKADRSVARSLSRHIEQYNLFRISTKAFDGLISAKETGKVAFNLALEELGVFALSLRPNNILTKDYTLTVTGAKGKEVRKRPACTTFSGEIAHELNSSARLTIASGIIYGTIKTGSKEYFIEPLHYLQKNAAADLFVLYETKDVKLDTSAICGVTEREQAKQKLTGTKKTAAGLSCVLTRLAIASDASMVERYGTAEAVAIHNIGVMNNVIWDYANAQFPTNIEFLIAGQHVSLLPANDQLLPAYTGTNAYTVLANFMGWGEAGNFGFDYDLAQFWTTRNLDNNGSGGNQGTIGLAYVGTVCSSFRYHILEDFAGNNPSGSGLQLQILTSHEIGHNFNCVHDAANNLFIMNPTIGTSNQWSNISINAVENFVSTLPCLASCAQERELLPDFTISPALVCSGGSDTLQLIDRTLGGPLSWKWFVQGGTPVVSSERNPKVAFSSGGLKNIILETNNGVTTTLLSKTVVVGTAPATACTPTAAALGTGGGIRLFSLNTITKASGTIVADGSRYLDFSCRNNTALLPGTTYSATAMVGSTSPNNIYNMVQFFIDYNDDGDFTDADEFIYSSTQCWIGSHGFSFTTPSTPPVTNKLLRARVIAKDCVSGDANACFSPINGQVEDYGVIFFAPATGCNLNYWTGAVSDAWENGANWSCGTEPDATSAVIITAEATRFPVIRSKASCKSIFNASGATLNIEPGFDLSISGNNQ